MQSANRGILPNTSKRLVELEVLDSELKSCKKSAKVYKQQPNSCVFFREDRMKVFNESKKTLDELRKEYEAAEKSEPSLAAEIEAEHPNPIP